MSKSTKEIHTNRPTSPHLTIYRWQITNTLSILHRITGLGLFISLSIICWFGILVVFSGFNPCIISLGNSIFFKLIIAAAFSALAFHLSTGIRHVLWDAGYGFGLRTVCITGWVAVIAAIVITAIFYYYIIA